MAEANQLRAKHKTFTFQSYSWNIVNSNKLKISFIYKISPDIFFDPSLTIHNVNQDMIDSLGKDAIDTYVFNIGLAEMFSYWKTTASPEIVINCGYLSPENTLFWQKLLLKGMGEYFYQNMIDFSQDNFIKIISNSNKKHSNIRAKTKTIHNKPKVMIPVGGGKDSSVSLEILKKHFDVGTYLVSAPKSAQNLIDISRINIENQIKITRNLDPKIFELNEKGYLNGHIPISAYLAFLSLLTADLFDYSHVAISNERSSNEGNVWYCDQEINHQYSKSYEFESDLQNYVTKNLPEGSPLYFSFMRPLYELQIAQIFSKLSEYQPVFRSCNRGQKQNIWCGNCSKCLFAWTIIFPFLAEEKMTAYFGKNLFEDEKLWPIAQELLGLSKAKPFDCVGTHEETIAAFYLSVQIYNNLKKKLPSLLSRVSHELLNNPKLQNGPEAENDYKLRAQKILYSWNDENSLPEEFTVILKKELDNSK